MMHIHKDDFNADGNLVPDKYWVRTRGLFNAPHMESTLQLRKLSAVEAEELLKELESSGYELVENTYSVNDNHLSGFLYDNKKMLLKGMYFNTPGMNPWIHIHHCKHEDLAELVDIVDKYGYKKTASRKQKINFIYKSQSGFSLLEEKFPKPVLLKDSYNTTMPLDDIEAAVASDGSGLILLTGPPGTGKSYYLRHLAGQLDKKFIYVPKDTAIHLSDPSFLPFAVGHLKDSILFIEDAEEILKPRSTSGNTAVSAILNIADGLMGDLLGMKIVCTLNMTENLDQALLRKGRLKIKAEFKPLSVQQANGVLEQLGKEMRVDRETTLAELYNTETNTGTIERKPVGFAVSSN